MWARGLEAQSGNSVMQLFKLHAGGEQVGNLRYTKKHGRSRAFSFTKLPGAAAEKGWGI